MSDGADFHDDDQDEWTDLNDAYEVEELLPPPVLRVVTDPPVPALPAVPAPPPPETREYRERKEAYLRRYTPEERALHERAGAALDRAYAYLNAEQSYATRVADQVLRMRARAEAEALYRLETVGDLVVPDLTSLTDFLATEDEPLRYRVDQVWPIGGRIVSAAQYKAGKSTLNANLIRALVDGEKFLGAFDVAPVEGTVVLIDNELDPRTLRRWLREQGVVNTDKVVVLPLRGKVSSFNILDPAVRSEWATRLREHNPSVVILDCLRPVLDALGLSEDKDAGRFLVAFDALLAEADAREALVTHHMGHNGERGRGDSRILDWPDANWNLVRESTGDEVDVAARRYFKAYGRDVEVPESLLAYDHAARRLTLAGGTRKDTALDGILPDLREYLGAVINDEDRSVRAIQEALRAHPRDNVRDALKRAAREGLLYTMPGARRAVLHYLTPEPPV